MDTNTLFERYSNYMVTKCDYDAINGVVNMTIQNPEDDSEHQVEFKKVCFYNQMVDVTTQKIQEEEDMPRAFLGITTENENLGTFNNFKLEYNFKVACSDCTILLQAESVELDGMVPEDYPEEIVVSDDYNFFYSDEELDEYEENDQWEKTIEYLEEKYKEEPARRDILFRLTVQNWYALTFKDRCGMDTKEQRAALKSRLKDLQAKAKEKFWDDADTLWLFGYMMEVNPFAFASVITYTDEIKLNGRKLINEAANKDPENLMAQVVLLSDEKKMMYKKKKKQLKPLLSKYFPGKSVVEKYFTEYFS